MLTPQAPAAVQLCSPGWIPDPPSPTVLLALAARLHHLRTPQKYAPLPHWRILEHPRSFLHATQGQELLL